MRGSCSRQQPSLQFLLLTHPKFYFFNLALRCFTGQESLVQGPFLPPHIHSLHDGTGKLSFPQKHINISSTQQFSVGSKCRWAGMSLAHDIKHLLAWTDLSLHRNQCLCWFCENLPFCSSISQAQSVCAGIASTGSCRNQPGRRWKADARTSVASADVPPSASQTWASWGWWNWLPFEWLYLIFFLKRDHRFLRGNCNSPFLLGKLFISEKKRGSYLKRMLWLAGKGAEDTPPNFIYLSEMRELI